MNILKKWWPTIAHWGISGVLFLQPSVQAFAEAHKAYSFVILAAWGSFLHWLTSPKNAETVAAVKAASVVPIQ
jgi:hypothetical protein